MDYITTDALNGDKWHFDAGWYIQKRDGVEISRLSLKNFPDPFLVWESKIKKTEGTINRPLTEEEKTSLKPRQYIFDMWEHRNAYFNNQLQPK